MKKITDGDVALIGKALGDPSRLAIYTQIAQHKEELFCGEIHAYCTVSLPTVSHHLKVLTDAGLIHPRKEGLYIYYRAVPERFAEYLQYLGDIGPKKGLP